MSKASQFGVTPQSQDFNEWYNEVVIKADLADYSPVRGSMVIKPYGYAIWEGVQRYLDDQFKATGHEALSFPLLIPQSFLTKEAEHVEGFAPELAVVTHAGGELLEEPLVIRPTSETIIGHMWSGWLNSYRDLPYLHYQWGNVMRWELRTKPFLRTAEFFWHEGHTAHENESEARQETMMLLDIYHDFCRDVLALPVIRGQKTASEKFPGAVDTFSIEGMMRDGKALQSGTSHYLGQNFAKAFDVKFQSREQKEEFVHTTSWAISTRIIGALIMTHGDDKGLMLPPRIAPVQVVIVPVTRKDNIDLVFAAADEVAAELKAAGIRVKVDKRDVSNGFKYNDWELKGVPVRLELGARDIEQGVVVLKNRTSADKETLSRNDALSGMATRLDDIQQALLLRAETFMTEHTQIVDDFEAFKATVEGDLWALALHCGDRDCEKAIKEETKATTRNIPARGERFDTPAEGCCVRCGKPSAYGKRVIFARSY